jgi:hypothetical protein
MTPKEQIAQFMRGEWTRGGFNRIFSYDGVAWQEGAFDGLGDYHRVTGRREFRYG